LFAYAGVGVRLNPPAPVIKVEHGVCGLPLNTTAVGQVTCVFEFAGVMLAVVEAVVLEV
jgi:hypothetical protein